MNSFDRDLVRNSILDWLKRGRYRVYAYRGEMTIEEIRSLIDSWGYRIEEVELNPYPQNGLITMVKRY